MSIRVLIYIVLILVSGVLASRADIVANYDFKGPSGNGPTASSSATVVAENVTAVEARWNGYKKAGFSDASGTAYVASAATGPVLDTVKYLEITVSAAAGYQLNLSALSFELGGDNASPTSDYTVYAVVRSNAVQKDFSSDLTYTTNATVASVPIASATTKSTLTTQTIDLAGTAFQNVKAVTFRFYLYDDASSGLMDRLGSITVNGSVVAASAAQ